MLRCRNCTATSAFCSAEVIWTRSCTAGNEKLHCNIEKAALQESGAFLPLSCGFQAPAFRHPRLGPAERGPRIRFPQCPAESEVPDLACRSPRCPSPRHPRPAEQCLAALSKALLALAGQHRAVPVQNTNKTLHIAKRRPNPEGLRHTN